LTEVTDGTRYSCLCGANVGESHIGTCQGFDILWTAWPADNTLPNTTGYHYLTAPVNLTANTQYGKIASADIYIDLNGQTVTSAASARILTFYRENEVNTSVTLTDSSVGHGGKLVSACTNTGMNSILLYLYNNGQANTGVLNVYRATLDASDRTNGNDGGAIRVDEGHTLNLYGATLKGCTTNYGSAIYNYGGTVNIADGSTITGTKANNQGGAIYNNGIMTITDSTVNGAATQTGGAILQNSGEITVKNSEINGAEVSGSGSAIYMFGGKLNLEDSTVNGVKAANNGGAICVGNGTLDLKNTIVNGAEAHFGGAMAILGGNVTMEGGKLVGANVSQGDSNGTAIHLKPTVEASFTMRNSDTQTAIIDSTGKIAANAGGAVNVDGYSAKATFTMESGEIKGGTAKNGGAVVVQDTSGNNRGFFIMKGGIISGGTSNSTTAGHGGDNIRVTTGGNFTMTGGTITGGAPNSTSNSGGVMIAGSGKMTISGAAMIYGNTGCDLYLASGKSIFIGADWAGNGENGALVVGMADGTGTFATAAEGVTLSEEQKAYFAGNVTLVDNTFVLN